MGSSSRLIAFFRTTRNRVTAYFRRSPFLAYPATAIVALAVCGLLVWLLAFRGGSEGADDVLGQSATPTPRPTATATPTPGTTVTPAGALAAAGTAPATPPASGPDSPPHTDSSENAEGPSSSSDAG